MTPPPVSVIFPAKVVEAVPVPTVSVLAPRVTELLATPLKSPTVVEPDVNALISKTDAALFTETAPVEAKDPEPDTLKVPALIVVPPV